MDRRQTDLGQSRTDRGRKTHCRTGEQERNSRVLLKQDNPAGHVEAAQGLVHLTTCASGESWDNLAS